MKEHPIPYSLTATENDDFIRITSSYIAIRKRKKYHYKRAP